MGRREKLLTEPFTKSLLANTADRTASWLKGPYEATRWRVHDDSGPNWQDLDFVFRMPNGRCLTETPIWFSVAREFSFWIRAGPYVRMRDACTHQRWHRVGLNTVHGLALRGFKSLEEVTEGDLEEYFEDAAFGIDGILRAESRVAKLLQPFNTLSELPGRFLQRKPQLKLNNKTIIKACNLPDSVVASRAFFDKLGVELDRLQGKPVPTTATASGTGDGEDSDLSGRKDEYGSLAGQDDEDGRLPSDDEKVEMAAGSIHGYISWFEALYSLKNVMNCPTIRFNPFLEETPCDVANRLGRATKRTPIAPHGLMIKLFEQSARILVHEWDAVEKRYKGAYQGYLESTVSWIAVRRARAEVLRVAKACFILIAGFTARRRTEVLLLVRDCLAGNDTRGWWLKVIIIKNQDHVSIWVTIPNIIARAVKTLVRIADLHRDVAQTHELFRLYDPRLQRFVRLQAYVGMTGFARDLGATTYVEDGEEKEWHWYPRQFRRFFAVVFFHRFNGGMETLAHELSDWSLDQVRGYATLDTEAARYWLKTEQEFKRRIASSIANDEDEYSGPLADRYRKLSDRLKRMLRGKVVMVDQSAAEMLVRHMGREANVFTPNAWSTCGCPHTERGTAKANCRKRQRGEGLGANLAQAGSSVCGDCPWSMQNAVQRCYVARDAVATKAAIDDCRPQNLFKMLQERRYLRLVASIGDQA